MKSKNSVNTKQDELLSILQKFTVNIANIKTIYH